MISNSFDSKPQVVPENLKQILNLRILKRKEAKVIKDAFLARIIRWHEEVRPDVIILTATSATPYGYLIKRAWKIAFPKEKQPIFMNINPKHLTGMGVHRIDENEDDALPAKRRIKEDDQVLVFDEVSRDPESKIDSSNLRRVTDLNTDNYGRTLSSVVNYLRTTNIARKNLWTDEGDYAATLFHIVKNGGRNSDGDSLRTPLKKDPVKRNGDSSPHLLLSKASTKEHRETAQDFIEDMEYIGQKIGEQISKDSSR